MKHLKIFALLSISFLLFHSCEEKVESKKKFIYTPDDIQKYLDSGNTAFFEGRYHEAIAFFDKGLEIDSQVSALYSGRGDARAYSGDLEGAMEDLNVAARLSPNKLKVFQARANLKLLLNDYEGAADDLKTVLELDSFHISAYRDLGGCQYFLGDLGNALQSLNKGIMYNPIDRDAFYLRAHVNFSLNRIDSACKDLQRSVDLGLTTAIPELAELCRVEKKYQ